jgi:Proprotein convertase P-domain
MLEVSPQLTWRDVQGVLASTAQVVSPTDTSWTKNSAGVSFSNKYGFGLVDATAAVAASRTWQNWGSEIEIKGESGTLDVEIPDLTQIASTTSVSDARNLVVESVTVYLDLPHQSRGDLKVNLTSPSGTVSVLAESKRPVNQQFKGDERWKFLSYAAWGESPVGNWTLTVADEAPGILSSCVDLDWGMVETDGTLVTCATLKAAGISDCSIAGIGATLLETVFEGRTPLDACCVCGGGIDVSGLQNMLKSWMIQIYAHDADVTPSPVVAAVTTAPGTQINSNSNSSTTPAPNPAFNGSIAPADLDLAVVLTTPPGVTKPWITNGSPDESAADPTAFRSLREKTSLLLLLGASIVASCFWC